MIARVFYVVSAAIAVALLVWAGIALLVGDQTGTFPGAFALWLATGLPLLMAGLLVHAFRLRRTSGRPPPHWPDWMRR
jgi:fatty acid desaturase